MHTGSSNASCRRDTEEAMTCSGHVRCRKWVQGEVTEGRVLGREAHQTLP